MKQITISRTEVSHRIIHCTCGWKDRTYPHSAVGLARQHNDNTHGRRYRIFDEINNKVVAPSLIQEVGNA